MFLADSRVSILLVDDSDDDVLLVQRAFQKAQFLTSLFVVKSGHEALLYLRGEHPYSDRTLYPLPELILLDLKMPGMDGFEVLSWIRGEPGLKHSRVLVLTSSNELRDVNLAYKLGANSFLVKPTDFEQYKGLVESIHEHWMTRNPNLKSA